MAPEIVAAERRQNVRRAARAFESAGFLREESRWAIEARYPDDRVRLPIGFRILAFLLTGIAILCVFGFVLLMGDGGGQREVAMLAAVFAVVCAVGTDLQRGLWRRADAGAELVTALLTLLFAALAVILWFSASDQPMAVALGLLTLIGIALAARWGTGVLGLLAALLLFGWLAQFNGGRLLWVVVAVISIGPLIAGSRHGALAPSQRVGCWLAAGVAVVALYLASNLVSVDQAWIEDLRLNFRTDLHTVSPTFAAVLRALAGVATAVLPLVLIAIGVRRRESLLLLLGLGCLAASVATFRYYEPLLPLAYALLLAGVVLLGTALGLRRWLRTGPGGERYGWTADALFTDESRTAVVQAVINAATFTPAARAAGVTEHPGVAERTGDGRFGGGGATGSY